MTLLFLEKHSSEVQKKRIVSEKRQKKEKNKLKFSKFNIFLFMKYNGEKRLE